MTSEAWFKILNPDCRKDSCRWIEVLKKYNRNHDNKGRFCTANGGSSGMNIDKAVAHLNSNASNKTQQQCAAYVRNAIAAGGVIINPPGGHNYAKDYGPSLEDVGFTRIPTSDYTPQKGDVAVIQSYPGGNPAGHMQMYNGAGWVSDFRQSTKRKIYPGGDYETYQPAYAIYRP